MQFRSVFLGLTLLLTSPARAGVMFGADLGYQGGTFRDFTLNGAHGTGSLGYELRLFRLAIYMGGMYRYSEYNYTVNGVKKLVRWYYTGGLGGVGIALTESFVLRARTSVAFDSKFFVISSSSVTINNNTEKVQEFTQYSGGLGQEVAAGFLKYGTSKVRFEAAPFWGIEASSINQTFKKRKQRTTVTKTDDERFEAIDRTKGTFKLSIAAISLIFGVSF